MTNKDTNEVWNEVHRGRNASKVSILKSFLLSSMCSPGSTFAPKMDLKSIKETFEAIIPKKANTSI